MRAEDFEDQRTLVAWLRERPRRDSIVIAHRAALRVLPLWGAAMGEDWARKGDLTALPLLRCGLISAVAGTWPTADIKEEADAALADAGVTTDAALATPASASADATLATTATSTATTTTTITTAADAAFAAADAAHATTATLAAAAADAVFLEAEADPLGLDLWPEGLPEWFVETEAKMLALWDADPPARWEFWRRWWEGAKSGQPVDPELLLAIVKGIDEEAWNDPDKVAAAIARIEERFGLLLETRELRAVLARAQSEVASLRQRSHNQPPKLVDDAAAQVSALAPLEEPLKAVEHELEKPVPDPSALARAGQYLLDAVAKVLTYCGKVSDVFVMTAAKTLGEEGAKWVSRGGALVLVESATGLGGRVLEFAQHLAQSTF